MVAHLPSPLVRPSMGALSVPFVAWMVNTVLAGPGVMLELLTALAFQAKTILRF